MKRRIISFTFFLLLIMTGLVSCGNLVAVDLAPDIPEAQTTVSITGECSLGGAFPEELIKGVGNTSSRSVFPSFDVQDYNLTVVAKAQNSSVEISGTISGYNFTIDNLTPGTQYTITVRVKNNAGNVILKGSDTIIPGETQSVSIVLQSASDGYGNLKLSIYNNALDRFSEDMRSMISGINLSRISYSLDGITNNIHRDGSLTGDSEQTEYIIDEDNLNSGAYILKIQIYEALQNGNNKAEKIFFQISEVVNIFSGLETNTWYRHTDNPYTSFHLMHTNAENGEGLFLKGPAEFHLAEALCKEFCTNGLYVFYVDPEATVNGNGMLFNPMNSLDDALDIAAAIVPEEGAGSYQAVVYLKNGSQATISKAHTFQKTYTFICALDTEGDKSTIHFAENGSITIENYSTVDFEGITFTSSNSGSCLTLTPSDVYSSLGLISCEIVNNGTGTALTVNKGTLQLENSVLSGSGTVVSVGADGKLNLNGSTKPAANSSVSIYIDGDDNNNGQINVYSDDFTIPETPFTVVLNAAIQSGQRLFSYDPNLGYANAENFNAFSFGTGCSVDSQGRLKKVKTIYVSPNGNNSNNGTSANSPYATLAHALEKAEDKDTILLERGQTFDASDESSDAPAQIYIDKSLTIGVYGDGTDKAIIDNTRLLIDYVMNSGNTLSINNIAFTESKDLSSDGAAFMEIYGTTGTVYCTDCTFTGKKTNSHSSAITIIDGTVNMTRCDFSNNKGEEAGAIYVYEVKKLTLDACAFEGNISEDGPGAIVVNKGTLEAKDSTFTSNGTDSVGGAIKSLDTLTLDGCTFTGNTGDRNKPDGVAFEGSLTLKGTTTLSDAERFEILDASASIAIDSTATVQDNNTNATQIPLYWDEISMTGTPFASGSGSLAAALFTIDEQVEGSYIINSSGTIVKSGASGSISTPAVFDDLTVTLAHCGGTQVAPTFKDNSSNGTTIALTDLSSISCEVTYYGDVVPAGKYVVSADYHISLSSSLPDGPYTITVYFTYKGKAYQASFPVTKEGDNVTLCNS